MQGRTHRVGGVLCAVAGYVILDSKGLLLKDVNPLIQLAVMYPFAIYGSVVPDLDHHWESSPAKDPISWGVNRVLHLTTNNPITNRSKLMKLFDAKHRSWQTHSEVFLLLLIFLNWLVISRGSGTDGIILRLMLSGFILGVISHLILDILTPEGVWGIIPSVIRKRKVMISVVPKSSFFATGGPWEKLVRIVMWVVTSLLLMYIAYSMCPYELKFNFY